MQLFERSFSSPVELIYTDGAYDSTRQLWTAIGGEVCLLYCGQWTRVLRPTSYLTNRASQRSAIRPFRSVLKPAATLSDGLLSRLPFGPAHVSGSVVGNVATSEEITDCLMSTHDSCALTPIYDPAAISWLLQDMQDAQGRGQIKSIVLRDSSGEATGWYMYFSKPGGGNTVLNMGSSTGSIAHVLEDLFARSRAEGALAVSGQMDPRFARELSEARCQLSFSQLGALMYSANDGIRNAIHRGDTTLSRLDGEWWMHFADGPWGTHQHQ